MSGLRKITILEHSGTSSYEVDALINPMFIVSITTQWSEHHDAVE